MRVTMISKACVIAAYRTKLEHIAQHNDVELSVIVPPHWGRGRGRTALEAGQAQGYNLVVAPIRFSGWFHWHHYPTLPQLLRELRPDLVHIDEEPYNLATYLALRSARRVGARALFFSWQNLLRRYPPPFGWMERYVYRHSNGALAGSEDAAQVLRRKGYDGYLDVVPQFGVDPRAFSPGDAPRRPQRPYTIGYAGRLVEEKGLEVLIEALTRLEDRWQALFVGEGPLRDALAGDLAAQGLAERLTWAGRVPSQEMPSYLRRMDVLVLPSLTRPNWKEQFGRVLIEAMACGVPVIGSESGEIPHVIAEAGKIVPEGDAAALRQALASLRADEALRQRLGQLGRRRVLAHYTQERIAERTVAVYRHILEEKSAR